MQYKASMIRGNLQAYISAAGGRGRIHSIPFRWRASSVVHLLYWVSSSIVKGGGRREGGIFLPGVSWMYAVYEAFYLSSTGCDSEQFDTAFVPGILGVPYNVWRFHIKNIMLCYQFTSFKEHISLVFTRKQTFPVVQLLSAVFGGFFCVEGKHRFLSLIG